METSRLETFADGVFAIAATLLIIDVSVRAEGDRLGHAVLHAWPQYAAYGVSFITIGIMWINHHDCMRQIGAIDRTFMVINLFLLMCIAFVPFPTNLIAEHFHDGGLRAAALTYGITLVATAICFNAFWFYPHAAPPARRRGRRPARDHRDLARLPARRPDLRRGDAPRALEPEGRRDLVRGDRGLLRALELRLRARRAAADLSAFGRVRVVPAPRRAGEQPEQERRHDRQEAVDQNGGDDVGVVAAEADQRTGEADLDDPDPARCDRQRAEQADERPGRERLDEADLRRR